MILESELTIRYLWLFVSMGSFTLILHTIKDFNSGVIDTRPNYLMKGLGLGFLLVAGLPLWYFLIIMIVMFIIPHFVKVLKSGDYNTLTWISILVFVFPYAFMFFIIAFVLQIVTIALVRVLIRMTGLYLSDSFPAHLIILTSYIVLIASISSTLQ
jgi:hypothetical protein